MRYASTNFNDVMIHDDDDGRWQQFNVQQFHVFRAMFIYEEMYGTCSCLIFKFVLFYNKLNCGMRWF